MIGEKSSVAANYSIESAAPIGEPVCMGMESALARLRPSSVANHLTVEEIHSLRVKIQEYSTTVRTSGDYRTDLEAKHTIGFGRETYVDPCPESDVDRCIGCVKGFMAGLAVDSAARHSLESFYSNNLPSPFLNSRRS